MSEFWKSTAPSWLGAGGTVALAAVAFFTLNPLIENLELRSANHRLTVERDELVLQRGKLVRDLETTNTKIGLAKEELLPLRQRIERFNIDLTAKREELKRAQEQVANTQNNNNKLTQMNSKMLETFNSQIAERRKLETTNNELRRANDELGRTSSDLKGRNVNLERQLENTGSELQDAQNELEDMRRGQRRYVIVSLVAKAKGFLRPSFSDAVWGFSAKHTFEFVSPSKSFGFNPKAAFDPPFSWTTAVTGQKVVVSLFNIPEFDLLKETGRLDLAREIQDFMGQHPEWFELELRGNIEVFKVFFDALSKKRRLKTAREQMRKILVVEGEPDRIPTERDIFQANDAFRSAESAWQATVEAADALQELFLEGLDEMKRELIAVAG